MMKRVHSNKIGTRARDLGLYLFVLGLPVLVMLLGFVFGWWETLARSAG